FDDLFNFVHDSATLIVAFARVAGNQGANTPGVDGVTAAWVEETVGVPGFLDDLRAALKDGSFHHSPGSGRDEDDDAMRLTRMYCAGLLLTQVRRPAGLADGRLHG